MMSAFRQLPGQRQAIIAAASVPERTAEGEWNARARFADAAEDVRAHGTTSLSPMPGGHESGSNAPGVQTRLSASWFSIVSPSAVGTSSIRQTTTRTVSYTH